MRIDKRVASFGDGPGVYREHMLQMGTLVSYDAFDGAPFAEETTNDRVAFLDLSVPVYHLAEYDWIVSLEVAEHIPREFESIYVDNLVRHAREGIILSWAVPEQEGHSHVNGREPEFVEYVMRKKGFELDADASVRLRNSAQASWLQNNILVFRRTT